MLTDFERERGVVGPADGFQLSGITLLSCLGKACATLLERRLQPLVKLKLCPGSMCQQLSHVVLWCIMVAYAVAVIHSVM